MLIETIHVEIVHGIAPVLAGLDRQRATGPGKDRLRPGAARPTPSRSHSAPLSIWLDQRHREAAPTQRFRHRNLDRSALHHRLQRHGLSRAPLEEAKQQRKRLRPHEIGQAHIDNGERSRQFTTSPFPRSHAKSPTRCLGVPDDRYLPLASNQNRLIGDRTLASMVDVDAIVRSEIA